MKAADPFNKWIVILPAILLSILLLTALSLLAKRHGIFSSVKLLSRFRAFNVRDDGIVRPHAASDASFEQLTDCNELLGYGNYLLCFSRKTSHD